MNSLWKKDLCAENGVYANIFENIAIEPLPCINELRKDNAISTQHRLNGNQMFSKSDWIYAMESYNACLRFAEIDSENVCFAYANRASCFLNMKMFDKCLVDIELAKRANYPKDLLWKLEKRKIDCMEKMKHEQQEQSLDRTLSYRADVHFPCMANVLKIQRNDEFGRHVIAKCDLPAGKTVLVEKSFLSATIKSPITACLGCQQNRMNFIACRNCTITMFCTESCEEEQCDLHKYDCNVKYHEDQETNAEWQTIAKSIFFALNTCDSVDDLMSFVEECETVKGNWLPKSVVDSKSKYRLFLTLTGKCLNESYETHLITKAKSVYTALMRRPMIVDSFDTERKQRFLQHLVTKHALNINLNGIYANQNHIQRVFTIGLVQSLFNHSCAPNVLNFSVGDQQVCITMRPIKQGNQLFISYILAEIPTVLRRMHLLNHFGFVCECEKCAATCDANVVRLKSDPCFQFLWRNPKPNLMVDHTRRSFKKKCIECLNKHGHLWSHELQFVLDLYIKSEMFEH